MCYNEYGDIMLDRVRESLQANSNLSEELKENLFELVAIFEKSYPNISLELLCDRLKTLKVTTISQFASKESIQYQINKNELVISKKSLEKEEDVRYLLMLGVLDMISLIESPDNEILAGFRQGYAALLANNLVGNESE